MIDLGNDAIRNKEDLNRILDEINVLLEENNEKLSEFLTKEDMEEIKETIVVFTHDIWKRHNILLGKIKTNINPNYDIIIFLHKEGEVNIELDTKGDLVKTSVQRQFDSYTELVFGDFIPLPNKLFGLSKDKV